MTLRIGDAERATLEAHLVGAYPEEGCGVMLGRERGGVRTIERIIGFENAREDGRGRRYLIPPERFLAADREARHEGLDVLGFFHSHPDHPARPSEFDREHAWPWYSYLIASVENGRIADVQSWRLADDRSRFDPEPLERRPDGARRGEPA